MASFFNKYCLLPGCIPERPPRPSKTSFSVGSQGVVLGVCGTSAWFTSKTVVSASTGDGGKLPELIHVRLFVRPPKLILDEEDRWRLRFSPPASSASWAISGLNERISNMVRMKLFPDVERDSTAMFSFGSALGRERRGTEPKLLRALPRTESKLLRADSCRITLSLEPNAVADERDGPATLVSAGTDKSTLALSFGSSLGRG
mmetsp:Transcript_11263/g.21489  ORF Transcript_11263/g.21489 Transcript_11263/m.21489 type:complete len:203 (-) Transcript_11263:193-801(-)